MESKKRSDRERLLKLIDGDVGTLSAIRKRNSIKAVLRKLKELVFLLNERTRQTFRKLIKGEISFSKLNLLSVRMVLVGILSVMIIYFIFDFARGIFLQKEEIFSANRKPQTANRITQIAKLSSLSYYLDQIRDKDLFNSQRVNLVKAEEKVSSGHFATNLKLVGVDWGGNPVALIEDTKTGKTYFVKKGGLIKELKVTEIFKDKVKLRYGNTIVELK